MDDARRENISTSRSASAMRRVCFAALAGLALFSLSGNARAGGPPVAAQDGFAKFCSQWMSKLAARERSNLHNVEFRKAEGALVGEYTGYEREPVSCVSKVSRPGKPGVGILVYHEIRYRVQGADRAKASASEPQVLERVEITEVFRYDGRRWKY